MVYVWNLGVRNVGLWDECAYFFSLLELSPSVLANNLNQINQWKIRLALVNIIYDIPMNRSFYLPYQMAIALLPINRWTKISSKTRV